jgi:hypothetical protein
MSGGVEPTVHADAAASARTARRGGRRRAAAVLLVALAWAGAGNHLFERGGLCRR